VVALYNAAGLISPLLYGRRTRAVVLRRRLAVVVATAMMLAMMVASSGVAAAAETYKGKGNGYGWVKNNGGFPGGGGGCGLC
jgi:hypothetical protein